ncbi:unnamed protein product [Prunus armeniaca]
MGDDFIEALVLDSKALEGIDEEYVDRTTSVDEDSAHVEISNVDSDDHGIGVRKDDTLFFFFGELDGFPSDSSNLTMASFSDTKNLRVPNDTHVVFYLSVDRMGNWRSATDQVNLPIIWLFDNFVKGNARLCVMAIVLVISAEYSGVLAMLVPVLVMTTELPTIWILVSSGFRLREHTHRWC